MLVLKKCFNMFLIGIAVIVLSGCGGGQEKSKKETKKGIESEVYAEFLKEQLEVCSMANQELSKINDKIRELNDKIHSKDKKLTEVQNQAIDEFEEKRAVLNRNMREIKSVSFEEWEAFKVTLENDLNEAKSKIDEILNGL